MLGDILWRLVSKGTMRTDFIVIGELRHHERFRIGTDSTGAHEVDYRVSLTTPKPFAGIRKDVIAFMDGDGTPETVPTFVTRA